MAGEAYETVATEATPRQDKKQNSAMSRDALAAIVGGKGMETDPCPPDCEETYERMSKNPTIALATAASNLVIERASYSFGGVSDEALEYLEEEFERLWPKLIADIALARRHGWAPFEKVWAIKADGRFTYRKIKPLRPDMTRILVDDHGSFLGFKQDQVELRGDQCFLYTNQAEYGNLYGRSVFENIRQDAWWPWQIARNKATEYETKVAGVIPIIEYPPGEGKDVNGNSVSNWEIAQAFIKGLRSGKGVCLPNTLAEYAAEFARTGGVDPGAMKSWNFSFLEAQNQHGQEFLADMQHSEALMVRGLFWPERALLEGKHGTKAEAGEHGETGESMATKEFASILREVRMHIACPMVAANFGEEQAQALTMKARGIDRGTVAFYRSIVTALTGSIDGPAIVEEESDLGQIFNAAGMPVADD